MNILQGQVSEEEQKKIIAIRDTFSEDLQSEQLRTDNSQRVGELSPESAEQIYEIIKSQQGWLEKQKNAKYIEIYSQYQSYKDSVKGVKNIDKPRVGFYQQLMIFPHVVVVESKKYPVELKDEVKKKLDGVETPFVKWYEKNKKTATLIQYSEKENDFYKAIKDAVNQDIKTYEILISNLRFIKGVKPTQFEKALDSMKKKSQEEIKQKESQGLTATEMGWESLSLASKIFFGGILVTIALLGGSFAANFGITQNTFYRVLYFIYGSLFFPITLLYALIVRIYRGPFDWYAFFPLTNNQGTTALTQFLLIPFYWEKNEAYEQKLIQQKEIFESVLA